MSTVDGPWKPRGCAEGFTLLELLVVIAIMGLIGGLAFPALDRSIKAQAFRTATVQIELAVRQAQADALRQNRTVDLASFQTGDRRGTIGLARGPLAGDLQIDQSNGLRFFHDGTSNGGMITLTSAGRRFRIEINAQTGVIRAGFA
jgi:prepilin-type N-terminal cleavage/methylation domain-containing protein